MIFEKYREKAFFPATAHVTRELLKFGLPLKFVFRNYILGVGGGGGGEGAGGNVNSFYA